ncbi:MAG: hypothetical protein ACR2GY_11835 [Phycisphaerales bacterium]
MHPTHTTASLTILAAVLTLAPLLGVGLAMSQPGMNAVQDPPAADPPATDPPAAEPDADVRLPRVVLQVGRYDTVNGEVEREDEAVIVIRTEDGELKAYPKTRIAKITRLADPAPGQHGDVIMVDGTIRSGIVVEDIYAWVVIEIEGIRTRFNRAIVDRVELHPTVEEQYATIKQTLRPEQYQQRVELARWLVNERRYALALKDLQAIEAEKPGLNGVASLLRFAQAQVALEADAQPEGIVNVPGGGTQREATEPDTGPVDASEVLPQKIISQDDVNLIRVYEIDFRNPPRVSIAPETIRALITGYASHEAIPASAEARQSLFRADPIDVVRLIFTVKARDLYSEIKVLSEPPALNLFRTRVHNTWLVNNCATSRCHGGVHAGRLFLHNRNPRDERVRYTNMLILERLKLDPAHPLINFDDAINSRVIQYGLPRNEARDPHPDVPGWKPAFSRSNPALLEDAVRWVNALYQPRPDYPVEYEPPILIGDEGGGSQPERPSIR